MINRSREGYWEAKRQPWYTSWIDESMSWKQACYIGDWSFLTKVLISGADALKLFSDLSVNSFTNYEIGQAKHVIQCKEDGNIVAEGILMRLDDEKFLYEGGPFVFWSAYMLQRGHYNAAAELISGYNFQVSGPNSLYLLEKLAGESIRDIEFMCFRKIKINDREVIALRQGMAGELGYELQGPKENSADIYNAILDIGKEFGIRRLGERAFAINHLEACFPTSTVDYIQAIFGEEDTEYREALKSAVYDVFSRHFTVAGSYESDDISAWYRNPVELGWVKNIKFDHEFIGRKVLEIEIAHPKRAMVTLEWNSDDVVDVYSSLFRKGELYEYMEMPRNGGGMMYADKVMKDGKLVGITTSRGYSVYFRKMLSLCTIDVELRTPGNEVTVIWGEPNKQQKYIRAKVAPAPYKKDNRRIDVTALPSYVKLGM